MDTNSSSKVLILGISETGEKIPAASGRISTQAGSATEIFAKSQDAEKNRKLINKVTMSGHTSTIEHTVFNLAFENVSVFAEQFIIEFRLASFTVKSRRYVDFSDSGYYIPTELKGEAREKYIKHNDRLFRDYAELTECGVPKEDARFILPYSLHSNFFCTVNARELLNMIKSMVYGRGAKFPELKDLGLQLLNGAREKAPGIMTDFEERCENTAFPKFPDFQNYIAETKSEQGFSAKLTAYTLDAENTVLASALAVQGYDSNSAEKIISCEKNRREIFDYLLSSPRPRALENANYTFSLRGISLSCLTHFTRHRMQSIQIPCLTNTRRDARVEPQFEDERLKEIYNSAFEDTLKLYAELKDCGIGENTLVYTLLSGNLIDIVTTMNARELLLFFKLRCCTRAQWEIRIHADEMLRLCKNVSPQLFEGFGPSCVSGNCPEGRMSCGQMSAMRKKYRGQAE